MTNAADPASAPVIRAVEVVKRFGGAIAVDRVSVDVQRGEIHAVVGENGAGKSTLMRMLAGVLTPDGGEVLVEGAPLSGGPRAALEAGVALVHQELSLVPEMTVAENIVLGTTPSNAGFIDRREMARIAGSALAEIGVEVDLDERVARLSVSLRQFVEIARAVARKPKVLILDEPTATLTPAETDYLLDMLQRLAAAGMAIIYISHRIPEVFRIGTNVTILRDGRLVTSGRLDQTTPGAVIDAMVGRELAKDLAIRREAHPGNVVLDARGIRAKKVHDVDLTVREGEIVGLGGLVGAGRTELVRAIVGADTRTGGTVTMTAGDRTRRIGSYRSAVNAGIGYVPEERRTDGAALTMTVIDNVALPNRWELSRWGVLQKKRIVEYVRQLAGDVGLRPPRITREVGEFSGGNQQKVVIAKWLGRNPKLIILDEPTRGVDVGAKAEIHRLVRALADDGAAVLVVSSDLPELLELSDLIHVIRDGRIVGTLSPEEATEKSVMSLASGERMVGA
ncbi:sugar ABC transporter ATP-binding protein [Microbacterium allomyrinae]|uniref:sugar ABC transporter ATP-binding protein n=1 Tax=Microbacterium allomyrinae TaxID=2830666 RepID=UPI001E41CB0E|nr:sugar ABC transporter ATP-binding protein [Microbacterium allomyrinae]